MNLLPILAAEDEETDAFFLRRAFQKANIPNPLILTRDGQETVDYLNGDPPFADRALHPLPGLLMLDLKMPRMTGFDVLAWLATRPDLKQLPVVVLSSSAADSDMLKAREMGARDYIVKPHNATDLTALVQQLCKRWLPLAH